MKIERTKDGYRLKLRRNPENFFLTMDEAIQLYQRFGRDFEKDAEDEEIQYQAEMVRRAKAIGL